MMGDPTSTLTGALGMELTHAGPQGKGLVGRCKRFALYAEDGVVKALQANKGRGATGASATPTIAAVAVSSFMLATAVSATAVATATASVFASASTAGKRGPRPQWRGGPGRRRFPRGLARAAGWKKNTGEAPTALAAPRGEGRA
jgi:hypothetical protein